MIAWSLFKHPVAWPSGSLLWLVLPLCAAVAIMPSAAVCPALDGAYRRAAGSAASMERARATAASLTPRLVAAIGDTWLRAAPGRGAPRLPAWSPYM